MAARRILTLSLAFSAAASASPRSDPTAGRAVFTGAATPSATSINLSPAAIGLGTVPRELYLGGTATLEQLHIDRKNLDLGSGTLTDGASIRDVELAPGGDVAVLWRPSGNDRLVVGGALRLPPPEIQPDNRGALRYQTLGGRERSYMASVAVSLKVTGAFYIGASLAHENTTLKLRYARDTALANGEEHIGVADSDELYAVDARSAWLSANNLRVTLGVVIRPVDGVWVGIGYHTPPGFDIQTELDGKIDVTRAPRDGGETIHGDSTVLVQYPASIDGEVRAALPRDLELHVGGRWEDLSRFTSYDVRAFNSTFMANNVPEQMLRARGMHDPIALWAGVEQVATSERSPVQLGARIGYETSSVDSSRLSALTFAPAAVTLDVGAQFLVTPNIAVQLSYGIAYAPTVSVGKSAFDPRYQYECIAGNYDYATRGCEAVRNGYAIDSAAGDYQRIDHATRIGLKYDW